MKSPIRKLRGGFQTLFVNNRIMRRIEKKYINNGIGMLSLRTPIFIIGLPRSGTTLLYQILTNNYHFAYFNNLSNLFYTAPVFTTITSLRVFGNYIPSNYKSRYGVVPGILAPSEAGYIFRDWFDKQIFKEQIKQSISKLSNGFDASFLTKNLYNIFRIDILNEIFPDAIFIVIERDMRYVGQSLLLARKSTSGNYKEWFGLEPIDYDSIRQIKNPIEQVACQVKSINGSIDKHLKIINDERKLYISYEKLCEDSMSVLQDVELFMKNNKVKIRKKENAILAEIKSADKIKLSEEEWLKLSKLIRIEE